MILSERSGRIRTPELEEEALRNDRTIETNRGGRRTAIPRMDHTTGAAKFRLGKQTKWSDWRGLISTQKIEVETSKSLPCDPPFFCICDNQGKKGQAKEVKKLLFYTNALISVHAPVQENMMGNCWPDSKY